MIRVALVGFGYWGPNLARCVTESVSAELAVICERSAGRADVARAMYPRVTLRPDVHAVLRDPTIDAVFLATPPATHADLACLALAHGKHVLVEKPLACSSVDAAAMADASEQYGRVLMVDYTYLFSPAFATIRRLIRERDLGPVRFYHSIRANCFGPSHETTVLWDLAVHDLAMLDLLMASAPASIRAVGLGPPDSQPESHAQLILAWPDRALASVQVSWIAPAKVRQVTIGFDRHTIVWDDLLVGGGVQLHDSGMEPIAGSGNRRLPRTIGESVPVPSAEPLAKAIDHFLDCTASGSSPLSGPAVGLRTVGLLEAAERSLASREGCPDSRVAIGVA